MECILVAYSEIWLKGKKTKKRFERILLDNIKKISNEFSLKIDRGRIYLFPKEKSSKERLLEKLKYVFGISYYALVKIVHFLNLNELGNNVAEMYKEQVKGKTFRITARRKGEHAFNSMDVQKVVGEYVRKCGAKVDLENWDINIYVEIANNVAYIYDKKCSGPNGLPLGAEGRVLVLFSGGLDSPVASWYVMKRGCKPSFLFINLGGEQNLNNVLNVCKALTDKWCPGHNIDFMVAEGVEIVERIKKCVAPAYSQVVLKKAFYKIAEKICKQKKLDAVITGESIGQVSTQTIRNIAAIQEGINCLFIRPIVGFDKEEVVRIAKNIGTYDLSIRVGELCNISKGAVKTSASGSDVEAQYKKISGAVDNVSIVTLTHSHAASINIPKKHEMINIDAQSINIKNLDKGIFYVITCKEGVLAEIECDKLKSLGYECVGIKTSSYNKIINKK